MLDRAPNAKIKVLIVDDEPVIADTLLMIFGHEGYEARQAYTAEEALEDVKEWMPHLAVIDVVLPMMNGIDFAVLLSALCPECKIMLFSGQSTAGDLLVAARARGHAFEIMAKPVHPSTLLAIAASLVVE
jgi:DNA-binding NtrC family response regulator